MMPDSFWFTVGMIGIVVICVFFAVFTVIWMKKADEEEKEGEEEWKNSKE